MSTELTDAARDLLAEAAALYADDEEAATTLASLRARLDEPLRVALAGRIKAGKSTLLNAIVGEQLAPTDTGECTRVVTWYRYGEVPAVEVVLRDGRTERRPVRRDGGQLLLDTGGHDLDEVARIMVTWPSRALAEMTVIDTPGLASLTTEVSERTTHALTPDHGGSEVDAVVYLMRHLHSSDAELMEAFREATVGGASPVGTLALLSRADEIGGGRIDAMVSAGQIADRYAEDPRVRTLALDVLPVAGLLAEGARTLRQVDFDALQELARLPAAEREDVLLSADRFSTLEQPLLRLATPQLRADLVARLSFFGVRIAIALLRGPVPDATALSAELTRRSGLGPLHQALSTQLARRATLLKTRSVLGALESLLTAVPRPAAAELADRAEALRHGDHSLVEAAWLVRLRRGEIPGLGPDLRKGAERLLGAGGDEAAARLSLPGSASAERLHDAAQEQLRTWQGVVVDPLSDQLTRSLAQAVIRSVDGVLVALGAR